MNIILDKLPITATINDIEYPINTNFRNFILFELMVNDKSLSTSEKIYSAYNLFFNGEVGGSIDEVIDKVIWFYNCGKVPEGSSGGEKHYSYEYDDKLIYAAFLTQYRVNLQTVEYIHWWEFVAMFQSLQDSHLFTKAIGYRSVKVPDNAGGAIKSFYKEMKEIFKLPNNKQADENKVLEEILMNGGNING